MCSHNNRCFSCINFTKVAHTIRGLSIDAIEAATGPNFKFYLQGNVMKYLWRFDYKGEPIKDLKKAQWYLERLIKEVTLEEYEKYGDTSSDSIC